MVNGYSAFLPSWHFLLCHHASHTSHTDGGAAVQLVLPPGGTKEGSVFRGSGNPITKSHDWKTTALPLIHSLPVTYW